MEISILSKDLAIIPAVCLALNCGLEKILETGFPEKKGMQVTGLLNSQTT
jgi:hypothetical protein